MSEYNDYNLLKSTSSYRSGHTKWCQGAGNPHEGVKTSTFHGSMQGSSVTLDNKIKEAEESCRKKPRSRIQIQEF